MRGAVIPTSVYKGIPTTFTQRRGIAVPRFMLLFNYSKGTYGVSLSYEMNKFLFLFTLMICSIVSNAQTSVNDHLTFKGVPIDGTLQEYVAKMKSAGFTYIGMKDGIGILKGDFAGFKDCLIGVITFKNSDVVNIIGVMLPKRDDWSSLESDYVRLKEMLTEKYGEPAECVEEFQDYRYIDDNNDKFYSLGMDRCTYMTEFETPKGNIILSLDHQGFSSCFVKLQYFDKINTETVKAKAMDDL